MNLSTKAKLVGGAVGLGVGALGAWTIADVVATRGVERVPYTRVGEIDGVELRRYPETVRVRTTAPSQGTAFRRLFRYIDGSNEGGAEVSMTAPVETDDAEGGVTMSFFLPSSYTPETAPEPTNDAVELVVDAPRTMAVLTFSWWTPALRVRQKERELQSVLDDAGIETISEPVLWRYDAPFTPPFRRTNEVLVEVDSESVRRALHEN